MKYDKNHALLSSSIEGLPPPSRGKVRDVYDLGDSLLFVATDRLSAFDVIMPNGVPDKGRVLTQLLLFWFRFFSGVPNHLVTADVRDYPAVLRPYAADLDGRSMIVEKLDMVPVECIARGGVAVLQGEGRDAVNVANVEMLPVANSSCQLGGASALIETAGRLPAAQSLGAAGRHIPHLTDCRSGRIIHNSQFANVYK